MTINKIFCKLKEYIPIKQGLRLLKLRDKAIIRVTQRVYSNKTRIKTGFNPSLSTTFIELKEYIPIKQGLRRIRCIVNCTFIRISKSIFQ